MASTSTSSRFNAVGAIRLTDGGSNIAAFSLLRIEDVPGTIDLASDGSVVETADYSMTVAFDRKNRLTELQISVNGEDPYTAEVGQARICSDGALEYEIRFPSNLGGTTSKKRMFLNTFGFARIEMVAHFEGEETPDVLSTKDIPCLSRDDLDTQNAEKMLTELLDSDDTLASRWMFTKSDRQKAPYSIIDGSLQDGAPKSLSAIVHLIEKVTVTYSMHQEYFRTHGYSRIVSRKTELPVRKIRRAGNQELLWISKNLQTFSETPSDSGIEYAGSYYLPTKVETGVRSKTFDSYENQLALGFLEEVLRTAKTVKTTLAEGSSSIRALEEKLTALSTESYVIPALALVRSYSLREKSYLTQIELLIGKAQELLRLYSFFMQGVKPKYSRNPRRTKVFQELQPYSQIFDLILEWMAFGDFSLAKEGLALHALRTDKLYEYYVLYRILLWLEKKGFVADESMENPIFIGYYHPERLYRPETQVSTVYNLTLRNTKVRLYYQPVIHGTNVEDEGITLHRLSSNSYWTPDYLIKLVTEDGETEYHALDAKYSAPNYLYGGRGESGYPKGGELSKCVMKYRLDIGGESPTDKVSSVWLLAGKGYRRSPIIAEYSSWAREHFHAKHSGIGSLTPAISHLDSYFEEICPSLLVNDASNKGNNAENLSTQAPETSSSNEMGSENAEAVVLNKYAESTAERKKSRSRSPQRKQGAHSSTQRFDEEVADLVSRLVEQLGCDDKLFDGRWASRELAVSHPLLRKRIPAGREGRYYTKMKLMGTEYYLFANWLPNQKIKLNNYVEKLEQNVKSE